VGGRASEDIYVMNARDNSSVPLVTTSQSEGWPIPSHSGEYVAYLKISGNAWDLCVVRMSDKKSVRLTDLADGTTCRYAAWSADDSKLFVHINGLDELPAIYEMPFNPKEADWK